MKIKEHSEIRTPGSFKRLLGIISTPVQRVNISKKNDI